MRTFAQKPKAAQQTQSPNSARPSRVLASQNREVSSILHLQRMIGNQAVQQLLQANAQECNDSVLSGISPRFVHDFSQIPVHGNANTNMQPKLRVNDPEDKYEQEADQVVRMPELQLQRASSCGGGGSRCQTKQPGHEHESLQPKRIGTSELGKSAAPTIGALDSLHERQADAVANAVMAGKRVPTITPLGHGLSRSCDTCEDEVDLQRKAAGPHTQDRAPAPAWEAAAAVANGGRPLSTSELGFFEPRFQHDFSRVRVHDGTRAGEAARSINARAYAFGQHIAFAPGEYQPHSSEGRRLMAHELAHTVQSGSQSTIRRTCPSGYQYDIYEDEVNFEDSVDAIRALPEFGALKDKDCGDGKKFANDIIDGARASACPGFYIKKLQPIFATDTAKPEVIKQKQQTVIDKAADEHGSKDWLEILNEGWEASKRTKITEDSQRQYRSVPASFGIVEDNFVDSFRIDSRNPQDVVVKLKVRLIPRGSGTQDDVKKTKRLEKAIEEHATLNNHRLKPEGLNYGLKVRIRIAQTTRPNRVPF